MFPMKGGESNGPESPIHLQLSLCRFTRRDLHTNQPKIVKNTASRIFNFLEYSSQCNHLPIKQINVYHIT